MADGLQKDTAVIPSNSLGAGSSRIVATVRASKWGVICADQCSWFGANW